MLYVVNGRKLNIFKLRLKYCLLSKTKTDNDLIPTM